MNHKVDSYITKHPEWVAELEELREIISTLDLQEQFKWGMPVYSHQSKNVIGIGATKKYVGIWFFQGGLLKDLQGKLVNAQEGKTQAMRQWRFANAKEIRQNQSLILEYIRESIDNFKSGMIIRPQTQKKLEIPVALKMLFDNNSALKDAYDQLSLSKKREFADYISEAKRESTKTKRLEKITPMILAGHGLNDRYR